MPALLSDIAKATRGEFAFDTQASSAVKARHIGARDTADRPRVSWLDSLADAATVNAAAFALVGTERRRFAVPVDGIATGRTLAAAASATTPAVRFVDAELAADVVGLVAKLELDLANEQTNLEVMG